MSTTPSGATGLGSRSRRASRAAVAASGGSTDQRVPHARELGHPLEQLDPPDVVAAEHVPLPRLAAVRGRQMAGGDVPHVDDVRLAVHDRGQTAAHVVADHSGRGLARPGAVDGHAEHVGGVHDDDLDPEPRAGRDCLRLTLVLCVHVGHAEPAAEERLLLVADLAGRDRADGSHARGHDHAPDPLGRGGLDRDPRAERVHRPDALGRPRRDVAGGVEHELAAAKGPPERCPVEHVGTDRLTSMPSRRSSRDSSR